MAAYVILSDLLLLRQILTAEAHSQERVIAQRREPVNRLTSGPTVCRQELRFACQAKSATRRTDRSWQSRQACVCPAVWTVTGVPRLLWAQAVSCEVTLDL